jgi:hypothetical protein
MHVITSCGTQTPKVYEFAPTVWKNDSMKRTYMVDDLLENDYLIGLNYEQMIKLLGERHAVIDDNPLYCAYFVRQAIGDDELLYVRFDDDGFIVSAVIGSS